MLRNELLTKINSNRNYRVDRRVMRRYFSQTGIYSWFGEDSYRIKSGKSCQRDDRKVTPIRDVDYILNVLNVTDLEVIVKSRAFRNTLNK